MQITNISRTMNALDINGISILASYLKLNETNYFRLQLQSAHRSPLPL